MSNDKRSWFIKEVSLGNLLIALPLIGGLFLAYGKWTSMGNKIEEHTAAIGVLATNLENFTQKYNDSQWRLEVAVTKLSVEIDERTIKAVK